MLEITMKKLGLATALVLAMTGAHAYQFEVQGQSEFLDTSLKQAVTKINFGFIAPSL